MKTWEKEMWVKIQSLHNNPNDKNNLEYMYLSLERISKEYLNTGQMKEGDFFDVPLEIGVDFRITFYKDYSTIDTGYKDIPTDKQQFLFSSVEEAEQYRKNKDSLKETIWNPVITKEDSYKKEYKTLYGYSMALKQQNLGIGYKRPQTLINQLKQMKPGEIIAFNNGKMYTVENNNGVTCALSFVSLNPENPTLKDFIARQGITVEFGDITTEQYFYNNSCDNLTCGVLGKYDISHFAVEQLNSLYAGMTQNSVKVLQFGDIHIHAHKNRFHKNLSFYDNHGNRIEEDDVKIILSWYHNAPIITKYEITDNNYMNIFNNEQMQSVIEDLYKDHKFDKVYDLLKSYAQLNHQSLSINLLTYKETEKNKYEAVSVVFSERNGKTQVGLVTYDKGNPTNEINSYKIINEAEFTTFCNDIFTNMLVISRNDIIQENIKERYPETPHMDQCVLNKILDHAALIRTNQNFIHTLQFESIENDNESLIQSYINFERLDE